MKKALFLSLFSGLLLTLAFPNYNLWISAWFGFVPLFFAIRNKSAWKAFLFSYFAGIIFWVGIIYWLIHVTLPGTVVLILYLAIYFGIFGLIFSTIDYRLSTIDPLLFISSLWVLLEYIRSHLFTGFPWALLGYSQYLALPVIQIVDITGVWGVSFLIMTVNMTIYSLIVKKRLYLLPVLCIVFVLSYGYIKIYRAQSPKPKTKTKISVIQANIPQELKWDPAAQEYILDKYEHLTEAASFDQPDLIIWPEASIPGIVGEDATSLQDTLDLSKEIKVPLLIGAVTRDNDEYFNSALLIKPSGEIAGRYDKLHLVPFGEYIPLKKFLPFLETIVPIGDITAGKEYTVFKAQSSKLKAQSKFSVLICFEDLFPELSREFVKKGADFMINITNDAWYKKTSAPYQHLQASVFRAVENRVFLARSANTGVSVFISPDGKIISRVRDKFGRDIFIGGYATQEIAMQKPSFTFYTRYGDFFPGICLLFVMYGIISLFKKGQ
jgi:apolipoprotein N-acyltransferase